jgi:dephospho-CoA kinase
MDAVVLGLSGKIASGKSTVAISFAQAVGLPHVSFGDYIRAVARQQGREESREVLQEIGAQLIENEIEGFCQAVLAQAEWQPGQSLVVDGIRHVEVQSVLRRLVAPSNLILVYIAVDEQTRKARLREEGIITEEQEERIEAHSTEKQVITVLPFIADEILDGTQPVPSLVEKLKTIVSGDVRGIYTGAGANYLVRQGHRVYIEQLKNKLESEHLGRYIAVEPSSGRYFLGDTGTEALLSAHSALPDARFYLTRVGSETAHSISGNVTRNR